MMGSRIASLFLLIFLSHTLPSHSSSFSVPISIVNLDRDTVRWETVISQLEAKDVPMDHVKKLTAVDGKALTKKQLLASATWIARWFATPGMIGCYLSHRDFWEKTLSGSAPYQVVLEDDVVLADDFCNKLQQAIAELEKCPETRDSWDVLMIGALGCVDPQGNYKLNRVHAFVAGGGRQARKVTEHCYVPRRPFGTHGYVLSKRGASKLLSKASLAAGHVDAVAWGVKDLNLLLIHPMLAHQAFEAPSTIGSVTKGIEKHLPNWTVDTYTGVTFKWAFNEPVILLPFTGLTLTVGRCLSIGVIGYALGVSLIKQYPWILPLHSGLCIAMYVFLRIMVMPSSPRGSISKSQLPASKATRIV